MLSVNVTKRRGAFILQARFAAPTPGVVALFGASGCGKTTLVDIVSGLLSADTGRVELEGAVLDDTRAGIHIPTERRSIGYVFQDARLFPHLRVAGNLQYGQRRAASTRARGPSSGTGSGPAIGWHEVISLLGLESLLERRPHALSGGERQRVALGRALLAQPRLLLLDEPLASLDSARRDEVLPYLERVRDRLRIPIVYVSHQFEEVVRLATHVVLMADGRVSGQGSLPEVSLSPQLGAMLGPDRVGAVINGIVRQTNVGGTAELQVGANTLRVSTDHAPVGSQVRIQLLARDLILATQMPTGLSVRNTLQGRVQELTDEEGETALVKVDIGGPVVLARVTREAAAELQLDAGRNVWVLVKAISTQGHTYRT